MRTELSFTSIFRMPQYIQVYETNNVMTHNLTITHKNFFLLITTTYNWYYHECKAFTKNGI